MLRRLAWASVASLSFVTERRDEIFERSRRDNERNHISGMLLFTGVHFLGVLEGDERDLDNLWLRLERDGRHHDPLRIGGAPCGIRWFPPWSLAHADHADVSGRIEALRSPTSDGSPQWADIIRPIMVSADSIPARRVLPS